MTLRAVLIGALAETPIHPGAGQSGGTIDLPVAREGGTDYPFVPGSSNKGSTISQTGRNPAWSGTRDQQGPIMFGDLRLLLLPLRSSHGAYKWATCPHLLERLSRDLQRSGYRMALPVPASMAVGTVESAESAGTPLLLEEMTFRVQNTVHKDVVGAVQRLMPKDGAYATTWARVEKQLLIMPDDDFAWFARFGLPVHAHNKLDEKTKTSGNLWYEETLPADTLLYSIAAPRSGATDAVQALQSMLTIIGQQKWFQFGGNETTGQGICRLHVMGEQAVIQTAVEP